MSDRARFEALDAADPLAALREAFTLPPGVRYFDGNSLGPQPKTARAAVLRVLEQGWGEALIRGWNDEGWFDLPDRTAEVLAPLLGRRRALWPWLIPPLSTFLSYWPRPWPLLRAAPDLRPQGYLSHGSLHGRGLGSWLGEARAELCTFPSLEALQSAVDATVAVVLLSHVDFRSGERLALPEITAAVHDHGALVLWDLAHSAVGDALALEAWGVDFAVGCGYKFLNGGPGAPAFAYVAQAHQATLAQPLAGWFGHARPFAFEPSYDPAAGVDRLKCGTPPILSLAALAGALKLFEGVSPAALREKSLALTSAFMEAVAARPALKDFHCLTPWDPERRGSQVAFVHPEAYALIQALQDDGVIGDFRAPNILRFGVSPAVLRFIDVFDAVECLEATVRRSPCGCPLPNGQGGHLIWQRNCFRRSVSLAGLLAALAVFAPAKASPQAEAEAVLDSLHRYASEAALEPYLSLFTEDGVFSVRTAASAGPWPSSPPTSRLALRPVRGGPTTPRSATWISARTGPWLGLTRWWWARAWGRAGERGVLRKTADGWRIAQYSLTLLVPNDLAQSVVDRIQAYEQEWPFEL